MNEVVIGKVQSVHRCIERAREEYYATTPEAFRTDHSHQDASVLNLIRACEQCIDLANYLVREYKMGIPTSSAESFQLLHAKGVLPEALYDRLIGLMGFRNIAVHQYEKLDLEIVINVLEERVDDLTAFTDLVADFIQDHEK